MSNHVLVIAFGQQDFYLQANLLLLSLLSSSDSAPRSVHLYTDDPKWIPEQIRNNLTIRTITKTEINQLKGPQNFIHRVKIALIEDLCRKVEGNILYIDTDCIVDENLSDLFEEMSKGRFIMHRYELSMDRPEEIIDDHYLELQSVLTKKAGQPDPISTRYNLSKSSFQVWNAGVVGGPVDKILNLIHEVFDLTHYLYNLSPMHTSEQVAFSLVFQNNGTLVKASPYIYHYWDINEKQAVTEFIEHNLARLNEKFIKKGTIDNELIPDVFRKKISNSYIVKRNKSLFAFETNSFSQGYKNMFCAIYKKPGLDSHFRKELTFHMRRHLRYLAKKMIGKVSTVESNYGNSV